MNNKRLKFIEEAITQLAICLAADATPTTESRLHAFIANLDKLSAELDEQEDIDKLKGIDETSQLWGRIKGDDVDRDLYGRFNEDPQVNEHAVNQWLDLYFGEHNGHPLLTLPYFKDVQQKTRAVLEVWMEQQPNESAQYGITKVSHPLTTLDDGMAWTELVMVRRSPVGLQGESLTVTLAVTHATEWLLHPVTHQKYHLLGDDFVKAVDAARVFIRNDLGLDWPHLTTTVVIPRIAKPMYQLTIPSWDNQKERITWEEGIPHITPVYANGYVRHENMCPVPEFSQLEYNHLLTFPDIQFLDD